MPAGLNVRGSMTGARWLMAAAIAVSLASAAPAATVRHHTKLHAKPAPAAAQSYEARYQACRIEAFRRFGWHYGERLVLYTDFAVAQTDFCVRNGGHF
jgi:hypothetical protein